jgi:hypothetical protein
MRRLVPSARARSAEQAADPRHGSRHIFAAAFGASIALLPVASRSTLRSSQSSASRHGRSSAPGISTLSCAFGSRSASVRPRKLVKSVRHPAIPANGTGCPSGKSKALPCQSMAGGCGLRAAVS